MAQLVVTLSPEDIDLMKKHYANTLEPAPAGAVFRAKTSQAVITAYRSGKVLFQGKAPEAEASRWNQSAAKSGTRHHSSPVSHSHSPANSLFASNHIGSDEAGTGDYFGPITVACAYTSAENIPLLKQIGVKDSKALSDNTIKNLAQEIIHMRIPYSLLILHNPKYNQLQQLGWTQGKMKAVLHQHAINKLISKIGTAPLEGILIDQFCQPDIYKRHISSEHLALHPKTYFMTKAESYSIAVATGSILARAAFVREMDELSEQVGIPLPKGASKKVDQTIAQIISSKGEQTLQTCAKVHFANTLKGKRLM